MKNFLINIKKYSLVVIIITAVLGVLLIAYPDKMLTYAAYILGVGIIVCGIIAIISGLVKKGSKVAVVCGIIVIIFGILICVLHNQLMSAMIFIFGICLFAGGLFDLVNSIQVAIEKHRSWIVTVIMSIISMVVGVISIINPFKVQNTIVILIGCGLLLFAILEAISYIQIKRIAHNKKENEQRNSEADSAQEVDYEEVNSN